MKLLRLLLPICLALASFFLIQRFSAAEAAPNQMYAVTKSADSDDHACTPTDCSLREAVEAANNNPGLDAIGIPAFGTFGSVTLDLNHLVITDDLLIVCNGKTIDANGNYRAFVVFGDATLELERCTVEGGNVLNSIFSTDEGGSIYNQGTLLLNHSTLRHGRARIGGAIYNDRGTVILENSSIETSNATETGGAIHNRFASTLVISNSNIMANQAADGAGIYNDGGQITIADGSEIRANEADTFGGAIYQPRGSATIVDSVIEGNSAGYGAGVYQVVGDLAFSRTLIAANTAISVGGGIYVQGDFNAPLAAKTHIFSSTIQQNTARSSSGIGNFNAQMRIRHSKVFSNLAQLSAGGIQVGQEGRLDIEFSRLLGNQSGLDEIGGDGAGIYNFGRINAFSITLQNNNANFGISGSGPFLIRRGNGGGIYNSGAFSLTNSIVRVNRGGNGGGGIFNRSVFSAALTSIASNFDGGIVNQGSFSLTRSTVEQNQDGGILSEGDSLFIAQTTINDNDDYGVFASKGDVTIDNSTISGNQENGLRIDGDPGFDSSVPFSDRPATFVDAVLRSVTIAGNGGDAGVLVGSNGTISLTNALMSNFGTVSGDCQIRPVSGASTVITEIPAVLTAGVVNLDKDGTCDNATTGDAALAEFAYYGGWNWAYDLLEFSDAIGLGDAATCVAVGNVDQRGFVRDSSCDVGAVERNATPTAVTVRAVGVSAPSSSSGHSEIMSILFLTLFIVTSGKPYKNIACSVEARQAGAA